MPQKRNVKSNPPRIAENGPLRPGRTIRPDAKKTIFPAARLDFSPKKIYFMA